MAREKHPPGLYVLFFTEMWERFGFYSMLAMFTLYLKSDQGFGWPAADATTLYSNYLMFVYASPLVGGWIADRGLGYRNSVLIGGVIFMAGYLLLAVPALWALYLALTLLVIGNGFFKPNVSAMVGHLYPEGSPLKDRAYNIFYMGINIGAFLAPVVAEFMRELVGYRLAFTTAAGGMVISVTVLWIFKRYVEAPPQRVIPAAPNAGQHVQHTPDPEEAATTADVPPGDGRRPTRPIDLVPDWMRIGALIVIFLIVIVFWMVFHQNGSTLTYWADDNTNWNVSGVISNAINPFWVVTLTFPLVWFWGWLDRRGLEPSTPTKMAIGMLLTAVSFSILYMAARSGETAEVRPEMYAKGDFLLTERGLTNLTAAGVPADVAVKLETAKDENGKLLVLGKKFTTDDKGTGEQKLTASLDSVLGEEEATRYRPQVLKDGYLFKVSPLWLILAYAVVTLGELMLSPMGLSLVSKVAPVRMRGLMMGGWFVATAVGNKLTMIGVYWNYWLHSTFFITLGGMALVMAVVLFLLLRPLKKAMPGV